MAASADGTPVAEVKGKKPPKKEKESFEDFCGGGQQANTDIVVSELDELMPRYYIPSGIIPLDLILLNAESDCSPEAPKGFGTGRMTEIFGPNKSGKSELVQCVIRSHLATYEHGVVIFFDQEYSADNRKFQLTPEQKARTKAIRAANLEAFYTYVISELMRVIEFQKANPKLKIVPLVVLDSMATAKTKEEMERKVGQVIMAGQARINSECMPVVRSLIDKAHGHLLVVNQIRHKVGSHVPTQTTPGGESITFSADYRIESKNIGSWWVGSGKNPPKEKRPPDGFMIAMKTIKNKIAPPLRDIEIPLSFHRFGGENSGLSNVWGCFQALNGEMFYANAGRFKVKEQYLNGESGVTFARKEWPEFFKERRTEVISAMSVWAKGMLGGVSVSDDESAPS